MDDFHEGWVPATYLDPLYGTEDTAVQRLDPGEGEGGARERQEETGRDILME